jgi:exodeoxyribonuclease VIII
MSNYTGKHFLNDVVYREADGLANSDALMIEHNPGDFVWSKSAPRNNAKSKTTDIGTALHCAILEPEKYKDHIVVSALKGRTAKGFEAEQLENKNKVVLTSDEYDQVNLMAKSVLCHPAAKSILDLVGDCESSVFVEDKETGAHLKCRPDKDAVQSAGIVIDVKTTANIDDWRSDKQWINPLYKFNYGHGASFYTDVLEQHYNTEIESFVFLVIQNSVRLGRYPVAVFTISKAELIDLGFWDRHRANISEFSRCKKDSDWIHTETFNFGSWEADYLVNDDVEVTFEDEAK